MAWNDKTKKLIIKFLEAVENTMINRPKPEYAPMEWQIAFKELKKYVEKEG